MVYSINNTEYVLIKTPVHEKNMKELTNAVKEFDCIIQDWEVLMRFLFLSPRIKISILVPAKNVKKFSDKLFN